MAKTLVIIEDDDGVRALLERCLVAEGFRVIGLADAAEAKSVVHSNGADLVLVDIGLPDIDGLTLTRQISQETDAGIIIISGRRDLADRVVGLELGADDYITKPFEPREVVARVRSVLRRGARREAAGGAMTRHRRLTFAGWTIDITSQILFNSLGEAVELTSGEFKLLETLVSHSNRVLSRDQLLDLVYVHDTPAFDRSIDVRIGRLRKKLAGDARKLIKTIRNSGYMLAATVTQG